MKRMLKILLLLACAFTTGVGADAQEKKKDDKVPKTPPLDWQKELASLRDKFAKSGNATLEQTRIDRAYFDLNEDDPDQPPFLVFKGVCLRTAHDDEKQMKETLTKELSKFTVPNIKSVLKIDKIEFHDTPIYGLQEAAVAAHKNDAKVNVFFERATYGADGGFRLHVLYLQDAPSEKIAKLYEKDRPIPPELLTLPPGKTMKAPMVIRRDHDWATAVKALRAQCADDADPLFQRTRFDDAYLEYTEDRKDVQFHVDGVCVHPAGLADDAKRTKLWKERVSTRMPTVMIPKAKVMPMVAGVVMMANPSLAWQNDLASAEKHDGIFFQLAQFDGAGKLKVAVKLPSDPQRADVAKIIAEKPLPAKLTPLADKGPDFQTWVWSEVRPKGQGRLAEGDFLHHRARLDRVFLRYDNANTGEPYLHIDGVSLHPIEVVPADKQRKQLEATLTNLLPVSLDHKWNSGRVRFLTSPIYALQAEANTRKLDGMLFADGRYDKAGKLHLVVAIPTEDQRDAAKKIVDSTPVADGARGAGDAKSPPLLDFIVIPWADTFVQMQGWLARDNDTLLRKTRVDRGFFSYPASKIGPDLNLAALGLYPKKDAYTARLKKRFETFVLLFFTDQLQAGPVAAVPIVQNVEENPALFVQKKIPDAKTLDGVRLDDVSFDSKGKLVFHGMWAGKDQQKPLEGFVRTELTDDHPALKHGIVWGSMQDFDSRGLLLQMRTWVAAMEDIDEVWLERMYFDAVGKVRVSGFSTRAPDKEKTVRKLPDFLPKFESKKLPSIDPDEPPMTPPEKKDSDAAPVIFMQEPKDDGAIQIELLDKNIANYLCGQIPKLFKCDGLRIDRCYYDPQGVLRIDGLADRARHSEELKQFLDAETVPFDKKRQLAKGWVEGRQTVIPLAPMMVSLKENLPSLPGFDGLTIHRAHHNAKNELEFTVSAIVDADEKEIDAMLKKLRKELEPTLKQLLETHPRWRLRTSAGVALDITGGKKASRELAKKHVTRALHLLQVNIGEARVMELPLTEGWWSHAWPFEPKQPRVRPTDADYKDCLEILDAAILQDPTNVQAWYLRGYCLQTTNRADLSLRDFRRMVALEIEDGDLRHARILAIELVQGVLRQSAYRIEQNAILQVSDGWTLRELNERPAASK